MRVFLIGFMCSGKTTVGRILAPLIGLPFLDLDREVERRVGPLLPFIQREGESAFRELEAVVLQDMTTGPDAVIATGGGTPCMSDHMERMRAAGIVVWLDVPMAQLMHRIERSGGDRPLLFGLKGGPLRSLVEGLLAAREPVYARADIIVQAGEDPDTVAARIRSVL